MTRQITSVRAMEILHSHGNPTLRAFVTLDNGIVASASVPSDASTGENEAVEAGLASFHVVSNDGLGPDEPFTGVGSWLQFAKEPRHVQ